MAQDRKPWRDQVADEMIRHIEAGTAPWQKPWRAGEVINGPFNPTSGKPYRGINRLWLDMQGHSDPRWMTYDQAAAAGAQVRKGERSTSVEYWKWTERQAVRDAAGSPVLDGDGRQVYQDHQLSRPKVFYARVFNAEQIDGLAPYQAPAPSRNPVSDVADIFSALQDTVHDAVAGELAVEGLGFIHDQQDRAFYDPVRDNIHMPEPQLFKSDYEYAATALHELGHATGHKSRMDRQFGPFGSEIYAREELRAEMASYITCRSFGLGHYPERHASYLAGWLKVIKEDKNALFQAARDADRIATWIIEPEKRQQIELEMKAQRKGETMDKAQAKQQQEAAPDQKKPKIWLNVPFAEKDAAKAAGARWDRQNKSWFVREGADMEPFTQWRGGAAAAVEQSLSPGEEFAAALQQHGVVIKGAPVMDGAWHRASLDDDKPGAKSASYRAFLDGRPNGQIHNYKTNQTHQWVAGGPAPGAEELAEMKLQAAETSKRRQQELEATHAAVAKDANRLWEAGRMTATTNPGEGYLARKKIDAQGVRFDPENPNIMVPMRDIDGKLHSLQMINEFDGTKSFLKGGRMQGLMHVVGDEKLMENGFIVCEGYSTGVSLLKLTGRPVVIAFNAGNLELVATALREKYPDARMAIAADDDHKLEGKPIGNVGLTKAAAAAAAVGADLIIPPLRPEEKAKGLTDWNDIHVERGQNYAWEAFRKVYPHRPPQEQKREIASDGPGKIGRTFNRIREGIGL